MSELTTRDRLTAMNDLSIEFQTTIGSLYPSMAVFHSINFSADTEQEASENVFIVTVINFQVGAGMIPK